MKKTQLLRVMHMTSREKNRLKLIITLMTLTLSACGGPQQGGEIKYPDSSSPGAKLLQSKCSVCHGRPLPSAHTANVWPSVLYRMQTRMTTKGYQPLTKEEMIVLLDYMQRHARSK